jgi:hypothetical protein
LPFPIGCWRSYRGGHQYLDWARRGCVSQEIISRIRGGITEYHSKRKHHRQDRHKGRGLSVEDRKAVVLDIADHQRTGSHSWDYNCKIFEPLMQNH